MRDREWLVPVTIIVAIEFLLWWIAYLNGTAYAPMLRAYSTFTFSLFALIAGIRIVALVVHMARKGVPEPTKRLFAAENMPRAFAALFGLQLLAMGSSAFAVLKPGIPKVIPFWLDTPLAQAEQWALLGTDPWRLSHWLFGWATPAIDRLYSTFVPSHMIAVVAVLLMPPSSLKSRALITLALTWIVVGILGAYLFSSAGPIFHDLLFGGSRFAELTTVLRAEAPITVQTAAVLWNAYAFDHPLMVNGISAMPSMHVALTLWLALILHRTRFAVLGWAYYGFIWLGSVHLGWHYFSDGLVASLAVLALWHLAPKLAFTPEAWPFTRRNREAVASPAPAEDLTAV